MKKLLFLSAAMMLLASPAFAWTNNCPGGICAQAAVDVGQAQAQQQGQLQLQGQKQHQSLNNQNILNAGGGQGGAGGQGGQGGAGGSVTGGNVKSKNTNSNVNSNANSNTNTNENNSSAYNGGQSNSQSTTFQAGAYAPDAISNAPGFGVSVGIGVCAGQESHSGGGGVGIGVMGGPSIGVSGEYGNATMVENHQCDYRAHSQIFCNMPASHMINGVPAGYICDSILSKLDGAGDAIKAWNDAHAPKVKTVAALPLAFAPVQQASLPTASTRPLRCGFESPGTRWFQANCL